MQQLHIDGMTIGYSEVRDGPFVMKGNNEAELLEINQHYLRRLGVDPDKAVRVRMNYERTDFTRYKQVDAVEAGHILASQIDVYDGLATQTSQLTLFLPLADCIGAVIYDPIHKAFMVSHLGRHNIEQRGAVASIEFMTKTFNSQPSDCHVWLSPAAGKAKYPLFSFDNQSLHEVALQQCEDAGVLPESIMTDQRDTTQDEQLYSHSEYLKDARPLDGRFIITASLAL
jgi:copper oxidase (laccase) domain-containing protein